MRTEKIVGGRSSPSSLATVVLEGAWVKVHLNRRERALALSVQEGGERQALAREDVRDLMPCLAGGPKRRLMHPAVVDEASVGARSVSARRDFVCGKDWAFGLLRLDQKLVSKEMRSGESKSTRLHDRGLHRMRGRLLVRAVVASGGVGERARRRIARVLLDNSFQGAAS